MGDLVSFASNGDAAGGYLAAPADGGLGLVVIQEWWGLVPHIRDVCDRFAADGFVALAPDLYRGESTTEPDEAGKKMMALDLDRAARDIAGAARYLVSRGDVRGDGVGVIGFCMGGTLAVWSGAESDDVRAVVGCYPAPAWEKTPDWSRFAGKSAVMHLAAGDGGSAAEHIQAMAAGIRSGGGDVTLHDYPGTDHAFVNDTRREVYDAEAATLALDRSRAFFRAQLT